MHLPGKRELLLLPKRPTINNTSIPERAVLLPGTSGRFFVGPHEQLKFHQSLHNIAAQHLRACVPCVSVSLSRSRCLSLSICMSRCLSPCVSVLACVCACVWARVSVFVHACLYVCIYTYTQAHIHSHAHTNKKKIQVQIHSHARTHTPDLPREPLPAKDQAQTKP